MLNVDLATSQRGEQVDFSVVEEIVVFALESGVGFLLNLEDDIAWFYAGQLIALAAELDLVARLDAAVDVYVQDFSLDDRLLAVALLAAVLVADDFSFALAVGADGLEALDHGAHLAHHVLHAAAIAAGALLNGAVLATDAVALGADDGFLECELGYLAAVDILERDFVDVADCAGFLGALFASAAHAAAEHAAKGTAAAAEELREQILGCHAATSSHAALLKAFLAILVVYLALLRVRENFVCVGEVLELVRGLWVVGVLVGMPLKGSLLVCRL